MTTPPTRKGKITRDQVAQRERFVEEQLAALASLPEVYRLFREKFGVGQRTAERYARRVYDRWAAEGAASREAKRAEIERAADLTFRDARARNDSRAQVAALMLKTQLHGLNRPEAPAAAGDFDLVFELEGAPADRLSAEADVAAGGDLPGDGAAPGAGRGA